MRFANYLVMNPKSSFPLIWFMENCRQFSINGELKKYHREPKCTRRDTITPFCCSFVFDTTQVRPRFFFRDDACRKNVMVYVIRHWQSAKRASILHSILHFIRCVFQKFYGVIYISISHSVLHFITDLTLIRWFAWRSVAQFGAGRANSTL